MAIVEPLRVCLKCGEMLYDGMCPEGHEQPSNTKPVWPEWVKKPVTFTAQRREAAEKNAKEEDKDLFTKNALSENRDINTAMRLLDDKVVLDMLNDVALLTQQALVHNRKPETLSRMQRVIKHMHEMAESQYNYVKHCKNTHIPE